MPWRTVINNVLFPMEILGPPRRRGALAPRWSCCPSSGFHGFEQAYFPSAIVGRHAAARRLVPRALIHEPQAAADGRALRCPR